MTRLAALGGVVGPAGFIAAWAAGGAAAQDYSPVDDAISRLAAVDASTRPLMTAGFVSLGLGVPLFGLALRRRVGGPAWIAAVATGAATLGVAAFPLDRSDTVDLAHGACASAGYATLVAIPLLAARPLRRAWRPGWSSASVVAGVVSGAFLVATLGDRYHGLLQRAGLTVGHLWIMASAASFLATKDARAGR